MSNIQSPEWFLILSCTYLKDYFIFEIINVVIFIKVMIQNTTIKDFSGPKLCLKVYFLPNVPVERLFGRTSWKVESRFKCRA